MLRRAVASLLALPLLSCVPPEPPPAVVVVDAPRPLAVAARDGTCTARLRVQPISPDSSSCFIDARMRDQTGELLFPCDGGPAVARFRGARFEGTVQSEQVDLTLRTSFDFDDGCRWGSDQRIHGSLLSPTLGYTYNEAPEPGQSGCSRACTAEATIVVSDLQGR
jgi:hypothetical protein